MTVTGDGVQPHIAFRTPSSLKCESYMGLVSNDSIII